MQIVPRPAPGWAAPYVGKPYVARGECRSPGAEPAGWDCWGLVIEAGRALGWSLADFPWPSTTPRLLERARLMAETATSPAWIETPPDARRRANGVRWPGHPAVVLFEMRGWPLHVGLSDGRGDVLHVMPALPVTLQRLDDPDLPQTRTYYVPA